MSPEPPAKRQRLDDQGIAARPGPPISLEPTLDKLRAKIVSLPLARLQAAALAVLVAEPNGLLAQTIDSEHARIMERERTRAINFDHYSKSAWYEINSKYARLSGSKQYDVAGDAQSAVEGMLNSILEQTKEHSAYETKKSAVETMRKIFKSLLLAKNVVGHEIRKDCWDWDNKFLKVLGKFTEEELERLATEDDGAWVEKLREVVSLANGHDILEKLQENLDDLEAYQGEKDEEGEGEGEEENLADPGDGEEVDDGGDEDEE